MSFRGLYHEPRKFLIRFGPTTIFISMKSPQLPSSPPISVGNSASHQDDALPTIKSIKWRIALSVLLALHVLAVVAEPLRFFSRSPVKSSSEEARLIRNSLGRYVDFMYLSHGYFFFAPNPGPAHLLEIQIEPSRTLLWPDRKQQWPRLLYHRHFMLTEFYHTLFAPASLEGEAALDQQLLERWRADRDLYERLQASIRNNISKQHADRTVKLRRIEHALPTEEQVLQNGWSLTDPRLYSEIPEGTLQP